MTDPLRELAEARRAFGRILPSMQAADLGDAQLLEMTEISEQLSRDLESLKAALAGEVAWRSRPGLGNEGLASRHGHVHPLALIQQLTRSGFHEAARRVRVGMAMKASGVVFSPDRDAETSRASRVTNMCTTDTGDATSAYPFDAISIAVSRGEIGVEAADRVIRTLAPVVDVADSLALSQATATLVSEAANSNSDQLASMARGVRDTLARASVAEREHALREQRSLRRGPVVDGLRRVSLVLDPESDAILSGAIDAAMSPRLGGPRFVDPAGQERSARLLDDSRSNEQLALDTLVELVRIGVELDDGRILGATKPAVRVTIPLEHLLRQTSGAARSDPRACDGRNEHAGTDVSGCSDGVAWIEGSSEPSSAATARRYLCDRGALPIVLGGASEPLDVGRARRLFTAPQRTALVIRDGGCRWPNCDRPASWCEAHHIDPFSIGGKTDLADGVLLCRRHHLLLHNHNWRIHRDKTDYWITPPATADPSRTPIRMHSKAPPWNGPTTRMFPTDSAAAERPRERAG